MLFLSESRDDRSILKAFSHGYNVFLTYLKYYLYGFVEFLKDDQNTEHCHQFCDVIEDDFDLDLLDRESVFPS
jgi:hypothetical protein